MASGVDGQPSIALGAPSHAPRFIAKTRFRHARRPDADVEHTSSRSHRDHQPLRRYPQTGQATGLDAGSPISNHVLALAEKMPERYRALVLAGTGTGLCPGELFGLTV